jgi:hypothetical protein
MPTGFAALALSLLSHGPELLGDAEEFFNSIAHGTGGLGKVQNIMASLSHLTNAASNALPVAQAATPPSGGNP